MNKNNSGLEKYLRLKRKQVNLHLGQVLGELDGAPAVLKRAMRYSVLLGGKRVRPILCLAAFEAVGGKGKSALPAASALELLHCFSLVHDDLPCMDDDDLRRGRPTLHKVFGTGVAVLAGDALHTLAFRLLTQTDNLKVIQEVAAAIGSEGMIGGQIADILAEGKKTSLNDVRYIHVHKTAALIKTAIRTGAYIGRATPAQQRALSGYGENLGLAFQIVDDVLNLEGEEKKLGKKIGSDRLKDKATYPKAVGIGQSKKIAAKLIDKSKACLPSGKQYTRLADIADYILGQMK